MAYRFEKNPESGQSELIIDGWENGIAESPYNGITSIKNLNIRYLPGAVYSNYKRTLNTSATGIGIPTYWTRDPKTNTFYLIDSNGVVWQSANATTAWTQLTGNSGHLGGGQGIAVYKGYLFVFRDSAIDYYNISGMGWTFNWQTGLQSGVNHMALWGQDDILYFCNGAPPTTGGSTIGSIATLDTITQITLANPPVVGDISGTLNSNWTDPTGNYEVSFSDGQIVIANFINGSTAVTWYPAVTGSSDTTTITVTVPNMFDPSNPASYTYNNSALTLPGFEQAAVWLSELQVNLIVAAGKNLYPWDRSSTNFNGIPVPMRENIVRVVNILNNLYITAGVKGNIYISNGYSTSPWVKIPDSFFNVIDPQLIPGDMMAHRNKLYVGFSQGSSPFLCGVFSIDLQSKIINFENQNSFGLDASAVNTSFGQPSVLIDIESAAYDQYASAWYDGSEGGMDINTNAVYTDGETVIETDLVPVGTFLYPKTFVDIEFKLDKTMSANDSITVFGRQSLSDSYAQLGITTANSTLSDVYTPLVLQKWQWLQLKVVLTSGTTSDFIRLREMRIR